MKYSFLNKRISFILLFTFSALCGQKITVINHTPEPFTLKSGKKEIIINSNDQKELSETNRFSISSPTRLNRFINLFLEPADKMSISIEKDHKAVYKGDQASLHQYLNEQLNIDTFGNIDLYENAGSRKNSGELKITSEVLLMNIMKKANLQNILVSAEDKDSVKRLKNHIKYNWLNTLFSTVNRKDKDFKKEVLDYYFKKYIAADIEKFSCGSTLQFNVLETLAKNKDLLLAKLPTYPIVEHTEHDNVNQYLPPNCQKYYFRSKYNYLEHINGHNKEYYKKVLKEKFNDE